MLMQDNFDNLHACFLPVYIQQRPKLFQQPRTSTLFRKKKSQELTWYFHGKKSLEFVAIASK